MNLLVDKSKALKKWAPVLESLKVKDDEKREWMSEYAEMHLMSENVAYSTLGNLNGMGAVTAPVVGGTPGYVNGGQANGSGDVAQNLLPVSMKIAAQTIGLDLVAVKPTSSPRIELLFVDFKYDNNSDSLDADERPLVFKVRCATNQAELRTQLLLQMSLYSPAITQIVGGLSNRMFVYVHDITGVTYSYSVLNSNTEPTTTTTASGRLGILEFLGFSRIDGLPMFRSFRQVNTAANSASWNFISARNTFPSNPLVTVAEYMQGGLITYSGTTLSPITGHTGNSAVTTIELVSTMEDQIPGFSAGWNLNVGMTREVDERTYPGVIGPDIFTKAITVGDIEISSALKRTQIEDIKASTGMDIVQKLESVLINELTQTISKQIVAKIKELAVQNAATNTVPTGGFDFNVDTYIGPTGLGPAPGGETTHSIQRKLVAKINNASNFIATDGRIGPAQYLITNGNIASVLQDIAGYTINPVNAGKLNTNGQLYPMGNIGNIAIYVDPYMRWDDNRIFIGRKNTIEQPGLVFIPYLMAQSISLISEATFAPRLLIRSRYAIADIGFFPWKQFMSITVTDTHGILI